MTMVAVPLLVFVAAGPTSAHPPDHDHQHHDKVDSGTEHGSLADVGRKLSNPTSNVWALFTEFDLSFSGGNFNTGDAKVGSAMNFQPILPIPLADGWKLIVRPSVPIQFVRPQPDANSLDTYDYRAGISDIALPFLVKPALDHWIVGAGPTFLLPTSTSRDLGDQQWAMGPAGIV
jgi:hypothetical protein